MQYEVYNVIMNKIVRNKTYSSKEAAELLGININTFQRLARDGKIRVYQTGRNYRITGSSLMDYMGITESRTRNEILEDFATSIEKLFQILKSENKSTSVFLHQSIAMHADEKSIEKITEDINRYIALSKK